MYPHLSIADMPQLPITAFLNCSSNQSSLAQTIYIPCKNNCKNARERILLYCTVFVDIETNKILL